MKNEHLYDDISDLRKEFPEHANIITNWFSTLFSPHYPCITLPEEPFTGCLRVVDSHPNRFNDDRRREMVAWRILPTLSQWWAAGKWEHQFHNLKSVFLGKTYPHSFDQSESHTLVGESYRFGSTHPIAIFRRNNTLTAHFDSRESRVQAILNFE